MYNKIIRQYYLISFLSSAGGMSVIGAVYVTFLMKNGLDLLEVNLINAVFFTTLFVCEIPTGVFADVFGRKFSFVVSAVLTSIAMFCYGTSHSIVGFISAEIIAGVGRTFRTGAFQAWLVDSVRHHGYDGSLNKIFGKASLYGQIGAGIGAITGAYLSVINLAFPWFAGGIGMTIVAVFSYIVMREEYFVKIPLSWNNGIASMRDTAITSMRYGARDKNVRFILIVTFVQIYVVQSLNMYWQPFFSGHGVADEHLGFVYTGMMVFIAIGTFIASKINTYNKERQVIIGSMIYVGVVIALVTMLTNPPFVMVLFLLHEVGRGLWVPMSDSYLHHRIPSHERASISSFCGMAPHIGGAIGLVISGVIAKAFGITATWAVAASVILIGSFFVRKTGE